MAQVPLTANEQLLLELVNRARLDPAAEAVRYGISLNEGLAPGTLSSRPMQPLAPNGYLVDSARKHSVWMINTDNFSHTGAGGSSAGTRMTQSGYAFTGNWTWGENIAWSGTTGTPNVTLTTIELHENLFLSPGHRTNILEDYFRELGTGITTGVFTSGGRNWNAVMATENFATSGAKFYVTGVAYTDRDNDKFYDVGEARSGVTVTVKSGATTLGTDVTETAGGYSVGVTTTTGTVTFSGGGLTAPVSVSIIGGALNAKVDLVGWSTIYSSASATLGGGASSLRLLGSVDITGTGNTIANTITGNAGKNTINGHLGNDILTGGANTDSFLFNTALNATSNRDTITDFSVPQDTIRLENTGSGVFTLLANGALNAAFFKANASGAATDANDRIIYSTTTGALFYDTNGNVAGGATQFAVLSNKAALTAADFFVV
ncbi:MAG: CAP domain-containing protein [Hyphomicrobium sp.]|nr:CAP domain-containing protein [Hyphomicrobium sp.]